MIMYPQILDNAQEIKAGGTNLTYFKDADSNLLTPRKLADRMIYSSI